jgi:hypothetical protein
VCLLPPVCRCLAGRVGVEQQVPLHGFELVWHVSPGRVGAGGSPSNHVEPVTQDLGREQGIELTFDDEQGGAGYPEGTVG